MTTPCRSSTCDHLQCFDASLYLMMNEKKPKWQCPVCNKSGMHILTCLQLKISLCYFFSRQILQPETQLIENGASKSAKILLNHNARKFFIQTQRMKIYDKIIKNHKIIKFFISLPHDEHEIVLQSDAPSY